MAIPNTEYPNLALIRSGIENRFAIRCRDLELIVRPLSVLEETMIAEDVAEELSKKPPHMQLSIRQSSMLAIKKLAMAQTSDIGAKDGRMNEVELQRLNAGEMDYLFKEYVTGCEKRSPTLETLGTEKVDELVDHLKKNSQDLEMILTELSFYQLRDISRRLLTTQESPKVN